MLYYTKNNNKVNNKAVQYNKLWKPMIDKKIKEYTLNQVAGVPAFAPAKPSYDRYVSLEILGHICRALYYNIGDVV